MKQKLNKWMVLLATVLALGLATGCGSSDDDDSSSAAATTDSSGSTSGSADASDDAADAADADESAANTFDFTKQTPQALTSTQTSSSFLNTTVALSCGAIKTATQYTFTTDLGTSETVNAPTRTVTVTVQAKDFGKKLRYSVYAVNAAGESSQTASSVFSAN
jgi:hypothetical protein